MIDRDELLHVARLARLALHQDELDSTAAELSSILEHVAAIEELDLDGVEPTAHIGDVSDSLRADQVAPSLPRDIALAPAPAVRDDGFLVPSPQGD
jgi:aspartyl-tRNA(Asn)/glutamyl-tRNA(Gln) amidotransferase subunit C